MRVSPPYLALRPRMTCVAVGAETTADLSASVRYGDGYGSLSRNYHNSRIVDKIGAVLWSLGYLSTYFSMYGYLPSRTTSLPTGRYQVILLGETVVELSPQLRRGRHNQ